MYQASINITVCVQLSKIVPYLLSPRFCVLWFLFTNKGAIDPSILSRTFPSLLAYHLLSAVLKCFMNILLSPEYNQNFLLIHPHISYTNLNMFRVGIVLKTMKVGPFHIQGNTVFTPPSMASSAYYTMATLDLINMVLPSNLPSQLYAFLESPRYNTCSVQPNI